MTSNISIIYGIDALLTLDVLPVRTQRVLSQELQSLSNLWVIEQTVTVLPSASVELGIDSIMDYTGGWNTPARFIMMMIRLPESSAFKGMHIHRGVADNYWSFGYPGETTGTLYVPPGGGVLLFNNTEVAFARTWTGGLVQDGLLFENLDTLVKQTATVTFVFKKT